MKPSCLNHKNISSCTPKSRITRSPHLAHTTNFKHFTIPFCAHQSHPISSKMPAPDVEHHEHASPPISASLYETINMDDFKAPTDADGQTIPVALVPNDNTTLVTVDNYPLQPTPFDFPTQSHEESHHPQHSTQQTPLPPTRSFLAPDVLRHLHGQCDDRRSDCRSIRRDYVARSRRCWVWAGFYCVVSV